MNARDLPPQLIHLLADVFELGCTHGCRHETVTVLKLLKQVRPDVSPLALIEAWNLIEMRQFAAARELLDAAESEHPADPMTKAVLVMCLYLQGDSLWQAYASDVRRLPGNDEAVAMVAAIEEVAADVPVGRQARQYA
jgi:Bacterial type III secretion protein (HrpB1_HrpK)